MFLSIDESPISGFGGRLNYFELKSGGDPIRLRFSCLSLAAVHTTKPAETLKKFFGAVPNIC